MKFHLLLIPAAALALAACSDDQTEADPADVPDAISETGDTPLPSTDLGNTYPSQIGEQTTVTPGAEGGRSSATTGETPPGQGGDPNAQQQQQQQTTPP